MEIDVKNRWTLLEQVSGGKHPKWLARCECGKEKIVYIENIKRGKSVSCGCYRVEHLKETRTTHGQTGKTNTYKSWSHMKGRCLNQTDAAFKDYGGRGIKLCDRWHSFDNFYEDMGDCPPGHSIERIDVNGNYEPSNCKWIPRKLQARNTRKTRFNESLIIEIRAQLNAGVAASMLAQKYGTGAGHIRQIKREEIWKGV